MRELLLFTVTSLVSLHFLEDHRTMWPLVFAGVFYVGALIRVIHGPASLAAALANLGGIAIALLDWSLQ